MTRYLGCNQMRQTAFIWMLESDWKWNHHTFHQSAQQIGVETLQGKRQGSNLGLVPNPLFSAQGTLISTWWEKNKKTKLIDSEHICLKIRSKHTYRYVAILVFEDFFHILQFLHKMSDFILQHKFLQGKRKKQYIFNTNPHLFPIHSKWITLL